MTDLLWYPDIDNEQHYKQFYIYDPRCNQYKHVCYGLVHIPLPLD